jgi:hypothetical protein
MQTVNFQCGHCGKLMGVSGEFLGQQVRCPHCQQVVVAPLSAVPPPASPEASSFSPDLIQTVLQPPIPLADPEDIFSPPDVTEDLFGQPDAPRIEMPPEIAPELALTATTPYLPSGADAPPLNGENTAILPSAGQDASWMTGAATEVQVPSPEQTLTASEPPALAEDGVPSSQRLARRKESGTPWFLILVFSPLLLYSIVITVFSVMLYRQEREVEDKLRRRFEIMPDEGDNPGIQKGKKVSQWIYEPKVATLPLPADLITSLDDSGKVQPIRIGDLQVTPKRVERKRLKVFVQNHERPEPCLGDSLVLYLALKNLSSDYAFAPLDNYFDRYWTQGMDQLPPFTQLEVGSKTRFYGGPAHWYPRSSPNKERQWVEGRKAVEPELLQPGEEKEFFVCTDGQDPAALRTLFGVTEGEKAHTPYRGSFLWRIRVRRGLVQVLDKERSATAVVGVKFTSKDIQ